MGHSNHSLDVFIGLLAAHEIEVLVDTRSSPYSRYCPQFELHALNRAAGEAGISYVYLGGQLGGRPEEDAYYDAEGYVRYDAVAKRPEFLEGIRRIEALMDRRTALLCGEEDPDGCHRRLLIGRVLEQRGIELLHIRVDGRLQTESDLQEEAARGQMSLFEEPSDQPWRSAHPVKR